MIYDELKYFKKEELLSPEGLILLRDRGIQAQSTGSLLFLDRFREAIGKPISVNYPGKIELRGFRTPRENFAIYGTHRYTYHFWCAFDCTPSNMDLWEFFKAAVDYGWSGAYIHTERNFVHLDRRPGPKWHAKYENGRFMSVSV